MTATSLDETVIARDGMAVTRAEDWTLERMAAERAADTVAGTLRAQRQFERARLETLAGRVSALLARRGARRLPRR